MAIRKMPTRKTNKPKVAKSSPVRMGGEELMRLNRRLEDGFAIMDGWGYMDDSARSTNQVRESF